MNWDLKPILTTNDKQSLEAVQISSVNYYPKCVCFEIQLGKEGIFEDLAIK